MPNMEHKVEYQECRYSILIGDRWVDGQAIYVRSDGQKVKLLKFFRLLGLSVGSYRTEIVSGNTFSALCRHNYNSFRSKAAWEVSEDQIPDVVATYKGRTIDRAEPTNLDNISLMVAADSNIHWNGLQINMVCRVCLSRHANEPGSLNLDGGGIRVCTHCVHELELKVCYVCSCLGKDLKDVDGEFLCEKCVKTSCGECERCHETFRSRDLLRSLTGLYCEHCLSCTGIKEIVNRYNYVPRRTLFFKSSKDKEDSCYLSNSSKLGRKLYFGIETEVYTGNSKHNLPAILHKIGGMPQWMYWKHDGSIGIGFEMVTFPMTWAYLSDSSGRLGRIFKTLMALECSSFDNGRCGLHVHLSRDAFTKIHLYKFLKFFYGHPEFVTYVSNRQPNELSQWARTETNECWATMAKSGSQSSNKYSAINLRHEASVEIRIFNGTLRFSSFMKSLELAKAAYDFTGGLTSMASVGLSQFADFVAENHILYPHLDPFIKGCPKEILKNSPLSSASSLKKKRILEIAERARRASAVNAPSTPIRPSREEQYLMNERLHGWQEPTVSNPGVGQTNQQSVNRWRDD